MGLRFASRRHANVVVMAPALTETSQTQNFKFVTSPSRSPSLSLKNHLKKNPVAEEVQPKLSNGVENSTGMNGHSPANTTTLSINGIAKNLKNEFLPLEKRYSEADEKGKSDANYSITQIGGYIMNSGFVGDPDMGLQKSNNDLLDGEKGSPEVEQLQKNLAGIISAEINSNPVLNQNVEEIFKAMSSTLDSNASETEIESGPSAEHIFPDMGTALNGTELGSFDRGLFNEVDIMNMCVDESLVTVNKETLVRDRIEELRKRNFLVQRKLDYLTRRLRKIEARIVGKYAAEEITGVIEYSFNLTEASSRVRTFSGSGSDASLQCDNKSVSPSGMSLFMRQIEHAVNQQSNTIALNPGRQCKYFGSGSSTNSLVSTSNGVRASLPGSVLPPYPAHIRQNLESTSGELCAQMSKIQQDIDSEVTDSSSGCESSDEFINYNNAHQHQLTIGKRAMWKWMEERAAIAAKWTWLQSQIADLEYKIKLSCDLRRTVRADKGCMKFEGEPPPNLLLLGSYDENNCSRTRGLIRSTFGKRKLVQVHGLHRMSKKAARMPSLRCTCTNSIPGCGLCTGRLAPGQPVVPLASMPVPHRVAAIDPAFHPVLSFPNDVSASLHYDAVMKCTEWQSKANRIQGKSSTLSPPQSTSPPLEEKPRPGRPPINDGQVVDLQRSKAAALAVSFKLRRKIARGKRRRRNNLTLERYRRRKTSTGVSAGDSEEPTEQDIEATNASRYPSPVPSPASTSTSTQQAPTVSKDKDATVKRKRENSYDIDNIVIPYSIASSTRLEKLNYKEILTPRWRLVPKRDLGQETEPKNGMRRSSHDNMELDDNSEEAAIARHERCLIDEKKRFLSYLKLPGGINRGRAQRRTDSRADSSGPNTPDGMSPRDDGSASTDEPPLVNSPPPQPQPPPQPLPAPSEIETGRRRTISSSVQPQLVLCEVEPFERREFPLSDDVFSNVVENGDYQALPPNNPAYQSPAGPASPGSISTDSAESSFIGEDPNDPEWTSAERANKANNKR